MSISKKTLEFLEENQRQNSRVWYLDHKKEYEEFVLAPLVELVRLLGGTMHQIDPLLIIEPKVDKTISRIYRDTRFSLDKSLYREVMWCVFSRNKKVYDCPPGFVFEFSPDGFRYGCGYFQAPPKVMEAIRELILKKDKGFLAAQKAFHMQHLFKMEGDTYKRSRFSQEAEEMRLWLDRKNLAFMRNCTDIDLLFSTKLYETLAEGFQILKPIYEFLCKAEEYRNV